MSVDMAEFIKYKDKIEKMSKQYDIFIREFLLKQALDLIRKAKQKTPTDTGLLKNSWSVGSEAIALRFKNGKYKKVSGISAFEKEPSVDDITKEGEYLKITVSNPTEYASYVEYGHSQQPGRYVPAIGKKLKSGWVDGKFMLTLSIKEIQDKIPSRYKTEFTKWLKSLGVD